MPVTNARTGQVIPLYPDVLDDVEARGQALDIEAAARRIAVPWLILHGTEDEAVALAEGESLAAAAPPASTRFTPVAGAGHTFGAAHPWRGASADTDRVMDETLSLFSGSLR